MDPKKLKQLSRSDLLEMLLNLSKENEQLRQELQQATSKLEDRTIAAEKSGSLAEAALNLNGVFQAAQAACDQYKWNVQNSVNEGTINVTSKGSVKAGGIEGSNSDNGSQLKGCINNGDITVNSTGSSVWAAGIRADGNGQINNSSKNTGNVTVTTSANAIQLAGLAGNDGTTRVTASAQCNLTLNYTGTETPTVYSSLAIANRQGADATYDGTFGGTISLLDKDGNKLSTGTIYCGMLEGYTNANGTSKSVTLNNVSLKKGTIINGVEISEENYTTDEYLLPNLASDAMKIVHTKVTLVD